VIFEKNILDKLFFQSGCKAWSFKINRVGHYDRRFRIFCTILNFRVYFLTKWPKLQNKILLILSFDQVKFDLPTISPIIERGSEHQTTLCEKLQKITLSKL
jgi:hypothetical protein